MTEEVHCATCIQGECTTEDLGGLSLLQLRLLMVAARVIDSCLGTDKVDASFPDYPQKLSWMPIPVGLVWAVKVGTSQPLPDTTLPGLWLQLHLLDLHRRSRLGRVVGL